MKPLKDLLATKGNDVWSVAPETSVYDAIALMAEKEIGALLVMDNGAVLGIVSERDYARKVILKGRSSRDTHISEIMTTRVSYVGQDQSIEEGMAMMTDRHIRHLPVLDGDKLVGMISIGDLVKAIIAEQQFIIDQLEHYISG